MTSRIKLEDSIYKTLSNLIKKNQSIDIGSHIGFVKTLLYYVAKICFIVNQIDEERLSYNKIANYTSSDTQYKLPDAFNNLPSEFINDVNISFEDRRLIIENVLKISKQEISQISLGELFQSFITSEEKKYLGQVYTPKHIVREMISDGIKKEEIVSNPYFKIIDPACGGGYFLLEAYDRIKEILLENYDEIVLKNPLIKPEFEEGLHSFIIKNNLWGTDIDEFAVFMTTVSLYMKGKGCKNPSANVFKKDILLERRDTLFYLLDEGPKATDTIINEKFDLVIGNPPYIGHKKIESCYRKQLEERYYDVYSDKADISFCFFKKGYELLNQGGTLLFITSRYFLESPSAEGLRKFLTSNLVIEKILDFQGKKAFKGIGISPVIIKCKKGEFLKKETHIYKLDTSNIKNKKSKHLIMGEVFSQFVLNQETLSQKGWILINEEERAVYEKIHSRGDYYLNQVCICNQGVITGCDSAFIVDEKTIAKEGIERSLIKPWIKNSNIKKFKVNDSKLYIIYTDLIEDLGLFPNATNHIIPYKEKLNKRRECLRGVRQWYHLQWGRNLDVFSNPKIVFPFKAGTNRFAIVYEEVLCSADVYIISIDNLSSLVSLEYLSAFLNSSLFEFYFKSVAKKVGEYQYDYYPNKVMNLKIKIGKNTENIERKTQELIKLYKDLDIIKNEDKYNSITENNITKRINDINSHFYDLYELSEAQVGIIERSIANSVS